MKKTTLQDELDAIMNECAEALIVKHRLRNSHGQVVCWGCNVYVATMPSLHCEICLEKHRRSRGI